MTHHPAHMSSYLQPKKSQVQLVNCMPGQALDKGLRQGYRTAHLPMGCPSPIRPKYMAGPIRSRLNAKFIPHMGKRVPCKVYRSQIQKTKILGMIEVYYMKTRVEKPFNGFTLGIVMTAFTYFVLRSLGFTICVGAS